MNCEKTTVSVHHIDKDRTNNTIENLEIYCSSCHTTYHIKKGDCGWSIYNKRFVPNIGVEELKKELRAGKSIRNICKEYHTDHHTIGRLMDKYEIVIPTKVPPITIEQIKQHLSEGKSVRWMNREYKIQSHSLISDMIKENKIICPTRKYMKPNKPV